MLRSLGLGLTRFLGRRIKARAVAIVRVSFPKVVVGNLFLPWLFSSETTDPRLNSSGMTA